MKTKIEFVATHCAIAVLVGLFSHTGEAQTLQWNTQVRSVLQQADSNSESVIAHASQFAPNIAPHVKQLWSNEAELSVSYQGLHLSGTLQVLRQNSNTSQHTWINEAYYAFGSDSWQFSVGKRISGWDVGYGFRPNDVIQQEKRRSLVSTTLTGVPQLSAEYFTATDSLSVVWVNPQSQGDAKNFTDIAISSQESALAVRVYHRGENSDWYGFSRIGRDSGASIGAAFSSVPSDAIELHGSLRWQAKTIASRLSTNLNNKTLLFAHSPWENRSLGSSVTALIGATYTTESQHSFIVEYWWDGRALSNSDWRNWQQRQVRLSAASAVLPVSMHYPLGANFAWQAQAFSVNENLQTHNLFARWSWQHEAWQYSADTLINPSDAGRIVSINAQYQGNQWRAEAGIRVFGGPRNAIISALPNRAQAYAMLNWSF